MRLYRITNAITGKAYIGITKGGVRARLLRHFRDAKRHAWKSALHAAIRKYGQEVFSVEQIALASDWVSLKAMERAAIELYATFVPSGYNLTLGGDGLLGFNPDAAWRAAVSARMRGFKHSPESRARMSAAACGRKYSAEQIEKRVAPLRGRKRPPEVAAKTGWKRGRRHTEGANEKNRAAHIGRRHTDEARAKISAGQMGRKLSAETRAKLSARAKARGVSKAHIEHMVRCRLAKMKSAEA